MPEIHKKLHVYFVKRVTSDFHLYSYKTPVLIIKYILLPT